MDRYPTSVNSLPSGRALAVGRTPAAPPGASPSHERRRCLVLAGRQDLHPPQPVDRDGDSFSGVVNLCLRRFDAHAEAD